MPLSLASLITDDTLEPRKYLYFNMKIEEDFTHMTPAQKANAPRLAVNKQVFNFDTIAQNTSASDVIEITNQGRSPLIIRKIESQMPALTYSISTSTIEPGQKATLQITFKAQNRRHRQQCTLDIISNSPTNPIQTIKVEGFIMPK